jgi:hypothetical protein
MSTIDFFIVYINFLYESYYVLVKNKNVTLGIMKIVISQLID